MAVFLVTAPSTEPVSSTEAKAHLRVTDTAEDTLIGTLITAAREWAEAFTGRVLVTQTWDLKLDGFPCDGAIWLPKPPCQSVTSITYTDTNGDSQTWSSTLYTTDIPVGPFARQARIVPAYGQVFPQTRAVPNAVTVRFVAGYSTGVSAIPEAIKQAIKVRIGSLFGANRSGAVVGTIASIVPGTAGTKPFPADEVLLWPYKVW